MDGLSPFIYVLVFVAGLSFSEGLFLLFTGGDDERRKEIARERLKRHAKRLQSRSDADVQSIFREFRVRGPILRLLARLVPDRRPIDMLLYRAGLRMQMESFLGFSLLIGLLGFFVGNALMRSPIAGLAASGVGILPYLYVGKKKNDRMSAFVHQLPEAIELLCRSLKAGHPFQTGLAIAAEESEEPVSAEFGQVVEEMSLGLDPRVALDNLALRMNTPDMPFFITAVLIQRETGGDLPRVLTGLAKTMRERVQFASKVQAVVSQTKLSANILALFPFLFLGFISYAAPDYMAPLYTESGRGVLFTAFIFTFVGWTLCRRLTQVEI